MEPLHTLSEWALFPVRQVTCGDTSGYRGQYSGGVPRGRKAAVQNALKLRNKRLDGAKKKVCGVGQVGEVWDGHRERSEMHYLPVYVYSPHKPGYRRFLRETVYTTGERCCEYSCRGLFSKETAFY
jgi:hypothetical protein